ncbi:MAG: hypothetical protein ACREHG_04280 [Candidatus Saccharimonadales bacterium]
MAKTVPVYSQSQQGYVNTVGVGGDRFSFLPSSMFNPRPLVGVTNPVPLALLSVPPTYGQLGTLAGNGRGNIAATAGANPWSPSASLVPWVIFALIISVLGMHWLYYRKRARR